MFHDADSALDQRGVEVRLGRLPRRGAIVRKAAPELERESGC